MLLGFFIYYLLFIFIVPYLIYQRYGIQAVRFYLPIVDLIALALTVIEKDYLFADLYQIVPETWLAYISFNLITVLALTGVVWQNLYYYNKTHDVGETIKRTIIMLVVTYLLPLQLLPYIIEKFREWSTRDDEIERLMLYLFGGLIIFLLVAAEVLLIRYLVQTD